MQDIILLGESFDRAELLDRHADVAQLQLVAELPDGDLPGLHYNEVLGPLGLGGHPVGGLAES